MNDILERILETAKSSPKRIVLPESSDERILQAACELADQGIAKPVLLGNKDELEIAAASHGVSLSRCEIVDGQVLKEELVPWYAEKRGLKEAVAAKVLKKPVAIAAAAVGFGKVDGMVAGIASTTANVLSHASLSIGFAPGVSAPSSCFLMLAPPATFAPRLAYVFADCAVQTQPDARMLADIAVATSETARSLLNEEPIVALLSFSTKGSGVHSDVDKITQALVFAKESHPDLAIDGEFQADTAIVEAVASRKAPGSDIAGKANVLIFPDLDAANIAYKLTERLGGFQAVGPILQGFSKPVNDLSRGARVDDIVLTTALTCVQAQKTS